MNIHDRLAETSGYWLVGKYTSPRVMISAGLTSPVMSYGVYLQSFSRGLTGSGTCGAGDNRGPRTM